MDGIVLCTAGSPEEGAPACQMLRVGRLLSGLGRRPASQPRTLTSAEGGGGEGRPCLLPGDSALRTDPRPHPWKHLLARCIHLRHRQT